MLQLDSPLLDSRADSDLLLKQSSNFPAGPVVKKKNNNLKQKQYCNKSIKTLKIVHIQKKIFKKIKNKSQSRDGKDRNPLDDKHGGHLPEPRGKKVNTTCSGRDTSRQGSWMPQMYHDGKGTSSLLGDSSTKSTSPVSS